MSAKRLALTLVVVVSLVAMGSGAAAGATTTAPGSGAGASDCIPNSYDSPLSADSEVGTQCGGGGCITYCGW